jgi:membrane-bound lytic murein transglycosylase D
MKRLLNFRISLLSGLLVLASAIVPVTRIAAQGPDCSNPASPACYDPIAATLDSLVNQSFVQRMNASSATGSSSAFQPFEVPTYADDIYAKRMERIQTPIPMTFNDEVKRYINMYAVQKRGLTERVMGLANLYFPLYEQILDQQGLPLEFKYLSIVESALNPMAVSPVGATGLWQFMLPTGRLYGLKVNSLIDERRDPVKSTYAACQYFKDMYAIYNDWLLVIAAYNCGAGNVNRAITRSGGKRTFWEISPYLPRETRGYVPAFIAVTYLMNYSGEHNLTAVPPVVNFFDIDTVLVDQNVALREIADAIDIPYELLSYLNPVYKRGIIPDGEEGLPLRLPVNKVNTYLASLDRIYKPVETPVTPVLLAAGDDNAFDDGAGYVSETVKKFHKVRRGDNLGSIAGKYNCSVNDLKRWNRLKSTRLMTGQKLAVYVNVKKKNPALVARVNPVPPSTGTDTAAPVTDSTQANAATVAGTVTASNNTPTIPTPASMKVVYHIVQPGDTLWNIASRYEGVTVERIKEMNALRDNDIKVGTKLKVVIGG